MHIRETLLKEVSSVPEVKDLNEKVILAKADIDLKNELIKQYTPFILSILSKSQGRYIDTSNDELVSIGLLAFQEAIEKFNPEAGDFLRFASTVISRRAIDFCRKENRIPKSVYIEEDNHPEISQQSIGQYQEDVLVQQRKSEIIEFKEALSQWGLTFEILVKQSPKREILRELYKQMASFIVDEFELLASVKISGRLPIQKLVDQFRVNRKKVERGRVYILALVIILSGDYHLINEYIEKR